MFFTIKIHEKEFKFDISNFMIYVQIIQNQHH